MPEDIGDPIMEIDGDSGDSTKKPTQGQRIDAVEGALASIADAVSGIAAQLGELSRAQSAPARLPLTDSPEARLNRDPRDEAERTRRVYDFKNPRGPLDNLRPDDVVEPVAGSEFDGRVRSALHLGEDDVAPLGTILTYMFTTRDRAGKPGQPKYKVYFKGYGQDGCTHDQLRLVS